MNKIWTYMMLLSTAILFVLSPQNTLTEMFSASKSALALTLDMCTVYAVWLGFFEIMQESGLADKIAKFLFPLTKKLFKSNDVEANKHISINLSANLLGVGSAATPSGIEAMKMLDDKSGKMNFSMIMFLVVNTTSVQLLPTTTIGLRSSAGSVSPADIVLPTLLTTALTTLMGIVFVILISKIKKKVKK